MIEKLEIALEKQQDGMISAVCLTYLILHYVDV